MLKVFENYRQFEYDIHSLVKSFYPGEDVTITTDREEPFLSVFFPALCSEGEAGETEETDWEDARVRQMTQACRREQTIRVIAENGAAGGAEDGRGVVMEESERVSDPCDRTACKNGVKRALYRLLVRLCGRQLPWGNLTGIRPVRLVMNHLTEGMPEPEIRRFMQDTYYVSEGKTDLALEIAKRETKAIADAKRRGSYSLYVGIPFCPTTCLYCSFASNPIAGWRDRVDRYLDAVEKELKACAALMEGEKPSTVYVGGGTPTTLEPAQMKRLLTMLHTCFDLSDIGELTVESGRPDSITEEKLRVMKEMGVGRISINPQTFKDETLKIIGRHHTGEETLRAFHMAREAGFDNINMDLIMGLPGENLQDVEHTLSVVESLRPESLTVHSLAVKRASHLRAWMEENGSDSIVNTPAMMDLCEKKARELGLAPYYLYRQKNMAGNFENVGYAKEGCLGLYNIMTMEEVQSIVACGAGTVTKRVYGGGRIERCDNVKDVALYMDQIDEMIERKRKLLSET